MRWVKAAAAGIIALGLSAGAARAQSFPTFTQGQTLTAAQLNQLVAATQNAIGNQNGPMIFAPTVSQGTFNQPVINGIGSGANAAPGQVGEIISSNVASGSAVSLTSPNAANVTSVALTAGYWLCQGDIGFTPAGTTTMTKIAGGINSVSATVPVTGTSNVSNGFAVGSTLTTGVAQQQDTGDQIYNLSSGGAVYLVAQSTFAVSTMTAYGSLVCERLH